MKTEDYILIFAVSAALISVVFSAYADDNQLDLYGKVDYTRYENSLMFLHLVTGYYTETENTSFWQVTNQRRAAYFPEVDDFSQLLVSDAGGIFNESYEAVWFYLNMSGVVSVPRYFKNYNVVAGAFVTFFTAVVNMEKGVIQSITWDDDLCNTCDDVYCLNATVWSQQTCSIAYDDSVVNNCNATAASTGVCDLTVQNPFDNSDKFQIYLAWLGDDASGTQCTSYSKVPSKFQSYSAYPLYKAAAGLASDSLFDEQP